MNQKKIDAKVKQLNQNTTQFVKQSQQWMHLLENFNTALKVGLFYSSSLALDFCLDTNFFHFYLIRMPFAWLYNFFKKLKNN